MSGLRFARRALAAVALVAAAGGCEGLTRSLIKGKVRQTFAATMTPGTELVALGHGVYSYRWLSYRTAFVVTDDGVVLFDPLNREAARDLSRRIREVAGDRPLRYVIYSHAHRDHASGADALSPRPTILAHRVAAEELRARAYPDVLPPDEEIADDDYTLQVGGTAIRLLRLPGAHTEGMTAIYLPQYKILYAVDLVWPNQLPPPAVPLSFHGTRAALGRLLALDFETLVPGHGDISGRREVARYQAFLDDLRAAFSAALARHDLSDIHSSATFTRAPAELGGVFFEVEDALAPKYGDFTNFKEAILPTAQWAFWNALTGD